MHTDHDLPIKSTALSFDILETVHDLDGATLPEIADYFSKPKSTVHDHLKTLVNIGYLVQDGRTYRVSIKFLNLGGRARIKSPLFQVAEREIQQLADDMGEHANLMVEENGLGIFLYKVKGSQSVNLDTYEGMEVYLHTTAMGKAILAEFSEERRDQIIDQYGLPAVTENTITDRDQLDEELRMIRDRGYAVDNEERVEGVRCVAAPIMSGSDVVGAVSISAPRSRMSGKKFEDDIPTEVLSTVNVIEVNIQHR
ncbi:IclR family transcriptional regulator [Haladaptatus pallidirubidus]|nr:IclR family transcriptional regulator [Haladaptatus pallidirubidus]